MTTLAPSFETITEFENRVAKFFGAPYAVAVDSCTHGVELCLRYTKAQSIVVPTRTYLSIAFLANKLNIQLNWNDTEWKNFYSLTHNVIDAAVLWKKNSYVPGNMMCLSFQYQKHLSLGRGGMILLDNKDARDELVRMSYDGRERNTPWRNQNIKSVGYHYYMTPETAQLGLDKLEDAINIMPKQWAVTDWPDISQMEIFRND